jgi:molybdate transport system ATP-binding protein
MAARLTARIRRHLLDVDLSIDFDRGPVTVLFGPSAAGKTTLLRCLAGLDQPEPASRITLDDHIWVDNTGTWVPARRRRVGYLFQDHALFPHLNVDGNVGYGLHHLLRRDRPNRIRAALEIAGAAHLAGRPTRQLSGGESQRVALARALAPQPQLLLLDEPLSALDAPTRIRLRADLRRVLIAAAVPTVLVTHDRADALALGDQIAVLIDGRLRQLDTVQAVFSSPADPEVAHAVDTETVTPATVATVGEDLTVLHAGTATLLTVTDIGLAPGAQVLVCIRAENVALQTNPPREHADSPRNHLPATITTITDDGPLLRVDLDAGFPLAAYITRTTRDDLNLNPGTHVTAVIKAPAIHVIPRG